MTACGGGAGGEGASAPPLTLELGAFSATLPSRVSRTFLNPLGATATVTSPTAPGVFQFDPADLPAQVGPFGGVNLGIVFSPTGPGDHSEFVTLRFTAGAQVADQVYEFKASGESLSWTVTPDPADFGDVLPGEEAELQVTIRNDSQRSPVTFTSAIPPSPAVTLMGSPFPLQVQPGQTVALDVRFAPTAIGTGGGILRVGSADVGGPVDVTIWANSSGSGEQIIDFGDQALTNGQTEELSFDAPSTAVSITLEGTMGDLAEVGLRSFEGPGAKVYENNAGTGPLLWKEERNSFAIHIPSSDRPGTQLVPGGGTYKFRLFRFSGTGSTMKVRAIIERRQAGTNPNAILPLNVFLASGITPSAATAANDANLQSMFTQVGQILAPQGISLGDIAYYDIANAAFDQIAQGEEAQLFEHSALASKVRLNLFLVQQVWGGQLVGLSGSIDGAKRKGLSVTGVVSFYFDGQPGALAAIVAHEMCHYLGLWHTVEVNGVHDPIDDTPDCPWTGTNATCAVEGGDLLMHWQALGGKSLSNGQGHVLRAHALLHPAGQTNTKPRRPIGPWAPTRETLEFLRTLPVNWCGSHR